MSNQDAAHIRVLAERMRDDAAFEESRRHLRVVTLESGRLLARCASCPKDVRDLRKYGVWAFYSSTSVTAFWDAVEWFMAHRATDIHRWYADQDSPARFEHECSTAKRRKLKQVARTAPSRDEQLATLARDLSALIPASIRSETGDNRG